MVKNRVDFLSDHRYSIPTMDGIIYFNDSVELAEFLKHFTGCTAKFEVTRFGPLGWKLEFTGGF